MENLLLSITAVSVAMSAGLAVALAKVLRDERHRSEARVALLTELSAHASGSGRPTPARRGPAVVSRRPVPTTAVPAAPRATAVPDLEIRPSGGVAGVGELFQTPSRPSPWRWRSAAIAAMATVALVVAGIGRLRAPAAAPPPAAAAPAVVSRPLELVSLNHSRTDELLTITGLVQNPRGAAPLRRIVATALLLGPGGSVLTTAKAPLDFSTIGPGEESPFVIAIPVTATVERYRIAFRDEDGQVIAHVDKRGPESVARK
jgi:hypothetical protein